MALLVNGKKVYFTSAVTLPSDKKQFMSLEPFQIKTIYTDSQGILSKERLLLDIIVNYQICVGSDQESLLKTVAKIGIDNLANKEKVTATLYDVLTTTLKALVADFSYEVLDKDRGKLRKQLVEKLHGQLYGYHVDYLNIEKIELISLDNLAKQDKTLFKEQEQARDDWNGYQRQQLENRLKLVAELQQDLSNKIKRLIADYQRVIRQKINIFIYNGVEREKSRL